GAGEAKTIEEASMLLGAGAELLTRIQVRTGEIARRLQRAPVLRAEAGIGVGVDRDVDAELPQRPHRPRHDVGGVVLTETDAIEIAHAFAAIGGDGLEHRTARVGEIAMRGTPGAIERFDRAVTLAKKILERSGLVEETELSGVGL